MNKKIIIGLLVMIVLLPLALAYTVVVSCPQSVAPNSAFTCDLSLRDVGTDTVQTFQFKLSFPAGITAGSPLVTLPNSVLTWKGLDKTAVVFSMTSLTDGEFAKINLVSGTNGGDIDLVSKVPDFASVKATIVVGGPCVPSCTGKTCGDNGCGGSCGDCQSGQACRSGVCVAENTPSAYTITTDSEPKWNLLKCVSDTIDNSNYGLLQKLSAIASCLRSSDALK